MVNPAVIGAVVGAVSYLLVVVIGDPGVGKTLYGVYLIRKFIAQYGASRTVFTNILLFNIPYVEIKFEDFENEDFTTKQYKLIINTKDPNGELTYKDYDKTLHKFTQTILKDNMPFEDGLLVIDEIQEGSDAYRFLNSNVMRLNRFVSQVRKFDLDLFVITQRESFISRRLRILLNYKYYIGYHVYYDTALRTRTFTTGISKIKYVRVSASKEIIYKTEIKDLRDNFQFYATKQKLIGGRKNADEITNDKQVDDVMNK
jgi:GTPase SAR1 family protein